MCCIGMLRRCMIRPTSIKTRPTSSAARSPPTCWGFTNRWRRILPASVRSRGQTVIGGKGRLLAIGKGCFIAGNTVMSRRSFVMGWCLFGAAVVGYAIGHAQESAKLPAPADQQLKTLADQADYAVGLDLGAETLENAPDLNPELIARGLIDAMKKAKPLITPEQGQEAMSQFMAKKLGPGAEKNLADGKKFLTDNKAVKGVVTTESGLQYFVTRPGTGKSPQATD